MRKPRKPYTRGRSGEPVADKIARKSVMRANGCREWTGATDGRMGYGSICIDGVMRKAHRVAWEEANGRRVPTGIKVRHTCDNPPCVNPDHLVAGTQRDNVQDMLARGRTDRRSERNNSAVMTWERVRQLRADRAAGATTYALARDFGISQTQVRNIISNHHWKEEACPSPQ